MAQEVTKLDKFKLPRAQRTEITHILFLDDDLIIPDPKTLVRMFEFIRDKPAHIISGLYYGKNTPHFPLIMSEVETKDGLRFIFPFGPPAWKPIPENTVMKVGVVPAGFLLVKL